LGWLFDHLQQENVGLFRADAHNSIALTTIASNLFSGYREMSPETTASGTSLVTRELRKPQMPCIQTVPFERRLACATADVSTSPTRAVAQRRRELGAVVIRRTLLTDASSGAKCRGAKPLCIGLLLHAGGSGATSPCAGGADRSSASTGSDSGKSPSTGTSPLTGAYDDWVGAVRSDVVFWTCACRAQSARASKRQPSCRRHLQGRSFSVPLRRACRRRGSRPLGSKHDVASTRVQSPSVSSNCVFTLRKAFTFDNCNLSLSSSITSCFSCSGSTSASSTISTAFHHRAHWPHRASCRRQAPRRRRAPYQLHASPHGASCPYRVPPFPALFPRRAPCSGRASFPGQSRSPHRGRCSEREPRSCFQLSFYLVPDAYRKPSQL